MLELISRNPRPQTHETPLLFIHGAWHGAWCWDENFLPYFAAHGYAAHALSLRGHGKSSGHKRLRWSSITNYVTDVAETVQQLPEPPIIIGHSLGSFVVQKYLEKRAAPGAVLLASVPPKGVLRTTFNIARHHPLSFLKTNLKLSLYPIIGTPELAQEHLFSPDMPPEKMQSYFHRLQDESYRAFLDMLFLNLPRPKRVTTPMFVLGATKDTIFTPDEVKATARAYNAKVEFFPMAHDMMLEDGWQSVADSILFWLAEQDI